jgi:hypothetical protein
VRAALQPQLGDERLDVGVQALELVGDLDRRVHHAESRIMPS